MSEAFAAFLGAVFGSSLLVVRDWIIGAIETRKRAKYLAIRAIAVLDRFVDQCATASTDNGHLGHPSSPYSDAKTSTDAPDKIVFPDDLDWRSIDHKLAFGLLTLENRVYDLEQDIKAAGSFAYPPDYEEYYETRQTGYAKIGLAAAELARQLRDTHDLPRRTFDEWNAEQTLAKVTKEFAEKEERRRSFIPQAADWRPPDAPPTR